MEGHEYLEGRVAVITGDITKMGVDGVVALSPYLIFHLDGQVNKKIYQYTTIDVYR